MIMCSVWVQALITGVFSIVHQLMSLDCIPRVKVCCSCKFYESNVLQHVSSSI